MKEKVSYLILALMSCLVLISCKMPNQNDAFDSIRVGVILPLAGENKSYGESSLAGIELAVQELNRKNGINNRKVELLIRNNQSDLQKTESIMRDMITTSNVVAVVGGYTSDEALVMQKVAEDLQVPYISPIATNDDIGKFTEYTFRTSMNDSQQAAAMAYYLFYVQKYKHIGVMLDTSNAFIYSRALGVKSSQFFADVAHRAPLQATFESGNDDFSTQIDLFIRSGCEAIIMPTYLHTALKFIEQARNKGFSGAIVGFDSYDSPELYSNKSKFLGDVYFTSGYFSSNDSKFNQKFLENYQKNHKNLPTNIEALHYDAMQRLFKGLKDTYTPDMIAFNLRQTKTYPSVCGDLVVSSQDELLHPIYILRHYNKGIKLEKKIEAQALKKFKDFK